MSHAQLNRALAVLTLILAFAWLLVQEPVVPPHPDEDQYIWSAAYFGSRLWQLDMRTSGPDLLRDPGWSPNSWWSLTQPMGTRFLFAPVLGLASAEVPADPLLYDGVQTEFHEREAPPETRRLVRITASAAAALGLALIVLRLGWWSIFPCIVFLALPDVQESLVRAWAEGPLLLGSGLAVATYRTRWFPLACGVAATFKLTALGLWPLALVPGASGRLRPYLALAIMGATWSLLTPPSWFALGPFYLVLMIVDRLLEFQGQSALHATLFGLYLPSRYFWPPLLVALIIPSWIAHAILWKRRLGFRAAKLAVTRAVGRRSAESAF